MWSAKRDGRRDVTYMNDMKPSFASDVTCKHSFPTPIHVPTLNPTNQPTPQHTPLFRPLSPASSQPLPLPLSSPSSQSHPIPGQSVLSCRIPSRSPVFVPPGGDDDEGEEYAKQSRHNSG
ncbi:hypothetical protein Pcinc_044141 [Petrolisthes cinctipes]|uniref:Uncharacterized protein n=1 Tax=Petrolisthes cinctipes TaxID=88211 RepID=A0AAE1BEV5_PETCI|nr:hypothetical protein Pcinc_044141 [Petrolisthes cinctipes]